MSVRLMGAVWRLECGPTEKLVLLALADSANDDGVCWPSVTELVSKSGLSERAVQKVVGGLSERGLVKVHRRYKQSNIYQIDVAVLRTTVWGARRSGEPPSGERGADSEVHEVHPLKTLTSLNEPSKRNRQGRGTRIPDEFGLTPERETVARDEGLDPPRTLQKFVNYWRSVSGPRGVKADWDATWRVWCQTENERNPHAKAAVAKTQANDSRWSGLAARAERIGFRAPTAVESPDVYETSLKLAERDAPPVRPVAAVVAALGKLAQGKH